MFRQKKQYIPPSSQDTYTILFYTSINKLMELENEFLSQSTNLELIRPKIYYNLKFLKYLFTDKTLGQFIYVEMPVDSMGKPLNSETGEYTLKNQIVIMIDNLKLNWVRCKIFKYWKEAGGPDDLIPYDYHKKIELIKFLCELEKDFGNIDKDFIKDNKLIFYGLLNQKEKERLNTFQLSLLLKNKIDNLKPKDLDNINEYYQAGINIKLLTSEQINRLYTGLEKKIELKDTKDLTENDLIEYENYVSFNNLYILKIKQEKINKLKKKFLSYKLNELIDKKDYKANRNLILNLANTLETLKYEFSKEQNKIIKLLNEKLDLDIIKYKNTFDFKFWRPLFSQEELQAIKQYILLNLNGELCKIINGIFPMYKISNDIFCNINKHTKNKVYDENIDITKTTDLYCVILFLVGLINKKLEETEQGYQIILKGGKALQLLMSGMNLDPNKIIYKSNDIDIIINPINSILYDQNKCYCLSLNITFLIQWILNTSNNVYISENYVVYKRGDVYPNIIKISHKIQKTAFYQDNAFTAVSDIDFGQANKIFYSNLIYDSKNSQFGKLLFIYQNLDSFILEKIYYLSFYFEEIFKSIEIIKNINTSKEIVRKETINKNNNQRFIEKFLKQIKFASKIKILNESTNNHSLDNKVIIDKQKCFIKDLVKSNSQIPIDLNIGIINQLVFNYDPNIFN